MAKQSVCVKRIIGEGEYEFTFANGSRHVVRRSETPEFIDARLIDAGYLETYGNTYANVKGDANEAERRFIAKRMANLDGQWSARAAGSGVSSMNMTVEAAARMLPEWGTNEDTNHRLLAQARNWYERLEGDVKRSIAKTEQVARIIDQIKMERAEQRRKKEEVDTTSADEALQELLG